MTPASIRAPPYSLGRDGIRRPLRELALVRLRVVMAGDVVLGQTVFDPTIP